MLDRATLAQRQSLPLEAKILMSYHKMREWYDHWNGNVYVAFSGGKDSSVLLHMVREWLPGVPAVFNNTGLEHPSVLRVVKDTADVTWLKPKFTFKEVCARWGFPAVSKEVSHKVHLIRHTHSDAQRNYYLYGDNGAGKTTGYNLYKKWHFVVDAPFLVSDACCTYIKKQPSISFEKQTGLYPMLGTLAEESVLRRSRYLKVGCNSFDVKRPVSTPLAFWLEQDILQYIKEYNVTIPSCYGDIVGEPGKLSCTGYSRTGCVVCPFGQHLCHPNAFQRMAVQEPKLLSWVLDEMEMRQVLDFTKVDYSAYNCSA